MDIRECMMGLGNLKLNREVVGMEGVAKIAALFVF